jgi:hypothetical protein
MTPNKAALAVRARLRDDFQFYAAQALKIRTKSAEIVPFKLNHAQRILHAAVEKQKAENENMVRVIILKSRQQGLSTYVQGKLYHSTSQNKARKAVVVTHKADSTNALFSMTKRFHANVPEILRPSTSYSSRRELTFDKLDSSYMVATAGGDGIGRGETLTEGHLSELAFWAESSAKENYNGLMQAIPDVPGTQVYIESTANGVSGLFYTQWQEAVLGTNGYVPVFIPWFFDEGYQTRPPHDFDLTPEETDLVGLVEYTYGVTLTKAQLFWRRQKISQSGLDLFNQEYPAFPEDAFLTTGRPVFDPVALTKRKKEAPDPVRRMSFMFDRFEEHAVGELTLYSQINPGGTFYIGADVAMGVKNGDWSVAQVLDESKTQVATYRARVHPDHFADVLFALGTMFNQAKIAVESNNHGLLTVTRLYKELQYPNVYLTVTEDKMTDVETPNLGFRTTSKTRPLILDDLRAALRKDEIVLNDKTTMEEMLTFVVKENGKPEAEVGCHDDCVISLAIANHIHTGVWAPLKIPASAYSEMP